MRTLTDHNRVRRADDLPDLDVEGEEGIELGPGVLPEPDDRRVLLAQVSWNSLNRSVAAASFGAV
jgi:hypothetical protein